MIPETVFVLVVTGLLLVSIEMALWEAAVEQQVVIKKKPLQAADRVTPTSFEYTTWRDKQWYTSTVATLPPVGWEARFQRRKDQAVADLTHRSVSKFTSEPPPACIAAERLRREGTLSSILPAEWPCVKYPYGHAKGNPLLPGEYYIVKNVVLYNGEVYASSTESVGNYSVGGYFSSLKGKMHQIVESEIELKPLPKWVNITAAERHPIGIYQTPTDYHTMWHVLAEVLIPLFNAVLPWVGDRGGVGLVQAGGTRAWAVPGKDMLKLIKGIGSEWQICHHSGEKKCLSTEFGKMAKAMFTMFVDPRRDPVVFERFIVGTPTTCLPVWGLDGVAASAAKASHSGTECAAVLWAWKLFWDRHYGDNTVKINKPGRTYTVWASRKGDWARHVLNEDAVIHSIRALGHTVNVTKFAFPMKAQYHLMQKATHFIAPHGAAMMHSLFLQPSAHFFTIDAQFPPFTGPVIEPPWIHRHHYQAKLECNPQHPKNQKRCTHIFRKPAEKQNIHNQPVSQHNNHLSVNVSGFMEMYKSTL